MNTLSDRTLLVTVDSLRYDHYKLMTQTRASLGDSHPRAFATSNATPYSFQSIIGGTYPTKPGLDTGQSFVGEFAAAGVPTFGYQSNPLLASKYGYGDGFRTYDEIAPTAGPIKRFFETTLSEGNLSYELAARVYNQYQLLKSRSTEATRNYRTTESLVEQAITDVGQHGNPATTEWFIWIHVMEPHHPYNPSHEYTDVPRAKAQALTRKALSGRATPTEQELVRELYKQEVVETDETLDRLWKWMPDDTRVVFCADHGELLGEAADDWGHIKSFRPEILRVPIATKNTPETNDSLVSLVDIPSLLLGTAYENGTFNRQTAFAVNGSETAVTDGDTILSETQRFGIAGTTPPETTPQLERQLNKFNPKSPAPGLTESLDTQDLKDLGYI